MAEIVLGIGASHTTLMNTQWAKVDHLERAHRFRDGLGVAQQELSAARPDVVLILGSNHFRGFWLDLMPAFTIGVGTVLSSGEHGMPKGELLADTAFAGMLCERMIEDGFDLAFSTSLTVDHGISHAVQWILRDQAIPIVPIVINAFAPPLPTLRRVREFGEALRRVIAAYDSPTRVAVIATGGLSHELPFPDWRSPRTEDERFLADSFRQGRGRWEEYEVRRRQIVVSAPPVINEAFDQEFLNLLVSGRVREFPELVTDADLVRIAGNGANEVRAWLAMAAACGYAAGNLIAYAPMPEWLTGMAVVRLSSRECIQDTVCDMVAEPDSRTDANE